MFVLGVSEPEDGVFEVVEGMGVSVFVFYPFDEVDGVVGGVTFSVGGHEEDGEGGGVGDEGLFEGFYAEDFGLEIVLDSFFFEEIGEFGSCSGLRSVE